MEFGDLGRKNRAVPVTEGVELLGICIKTHLGAYNMLVAEGEPQAAAG